MTEQIIKTWRGGARLDGLNTTWPFAKLNIFREKLALNIYMSHNLVFRKDDIECLEVYKGSLPLIGRLSTGIGIFHNRTDYPEVVIFWYFGEGEPVVQELVERGFGKKATLTRYPHMF